jgi:hypothetical protein
LPDVFLASGLFASVLFPSVLFTKMMADGEFV